jgi:hypothetical protein
MHQPLHAATCQSVCVMRWKGCCLLPLLMLLLCAQLHLAYKFYCAQDAVHVTLAVKSVSAVPARTMLHTMHLLLRLHIVSKTARNCIVACA